MNTRKGFTLLEILIVGAFAGLAVVLFFIQKANVDAFNRDDLRKTAINAMYYALEEGFYAQNGYYPETISESNLPMMDPQLFTDPNGVNLGMAGSSYVYEPANCDNDGHCTQYTLSANLEKEATYTKRSR